MRNSLRFRLTIIFIGLATVPLLIVSFLLAQRNFSTLTDQVIFLQNEIAQRIAKDVTHLINDRQKELTYLINSSNILLLDDEEQLKLIALLLAQNNIYEQVTLINSAGQEIIHVDNLKIAGTDDLANRANAEEFQQPKETGEVYYSPVQFNKLTGEPFMIIAIPSYDLRSGEFNGVLTANFRFRSIWDLMSSVQLPEKNIVYLVDSHNRVVAHRDPSVVLQDTFIDLPEEDGFDAGLENDSAAIAIVANSFGEQTFYTVAEFESNAALELAISNFYLSIAAVLLALFIAIIISVLAARQIVGPIERMVVQTNAIAAGDLSQKIEVSRNDEIGDLATAFNLMTIQLHDLIGGLEAEIQERRQAEKSLQRYYDILESTNDFVGVANKDGLVTYVNRAGRQMMGMGESQDISSLFIKDFHPPEIVEIMFNEGLPTAVSAGIWADETTFLTFDGRKIATLQVILSHKSVQGEVEYFSTIARDITERKEAEKQLQQYAAELKRSNEELEKFAYISSHDLQEPLRKILVFGTRMQERYSSTLDARGMDYLQRMQNAAQRMQNLIEDLLNFSRASSTEILSFEKVDLNEILKEILSDLETRIQELEAHVLVAELPVIDADATQMRQLFLNLLSNGLKFHRQNEPPEIQIECAMIPKRHTAVSLCQISVIDNGIGFDEKYADRIFVMFQRLHSRTQIEGTGVGLALCRKIAEQHHGTITAHSPNETGAKFVVTLPITQS